jgi:hypothetical protein
MYETGTLRSRDVNINIRGRLEGILRTSVMIQLRGRMNSGDMRIENIVGERECYVNGNANSTGI